MQMRSDFLENNSPNPVCYAISQDADEHMYFLRSSILETHSQKAISLEALGYRWPSTGVKRPFPGKLQRKSEKGFPGPLGPGVKKGSKKSRK